MGTPDFAVPSLECLLDGDYEVVAVYTQPDKPAGRGRRLAGSPVKRLAVQRGIPVLQPGTLRAGEAAERLATLRPELGVVAAYGQLLPGEFLSVPRFGFLNVHPSLLPRHRGPSPVANAILCGDLTTGVSIMVMDAGMDTGPVVARAELAISDVETTGTLTSKLAGVGATLLQATVPGWIEGSIVPTAQDESQASYSRRVTAQQGELDWGQSATELWRCVRAYDPWPGAYTWFEGKRLKIREAAPVNERATGEPGWVVSLSGPPGVGVVTGRDVLGLRRVQLEGKRETVVSDFMRGRDGFLGSKLGRT